MSGSTEDEINTKTLVFLTLTLMSLVIGLVIHSFIIGVNVSDWWKGRSVTPVDHIITSLGISRTCAQCADILYLFILKLFLLNFSSKVMLRILDLVYAFCVYANVWLTTLLLFVFCLKISNLHNRLFLYLRRMIAQKTVRLIVASLLLSTFNCLLPIVLAITKVNNGGANTTTTAISSIDCSYIDSVYNYTIGPLFPLFFYSISSVLLFSSLYHHTTRMKMSSNLSINLETYYSVMRFVSITFIYNTIYFMGIIALVLYYYFYCLSVAWFYIIMDFLPVLHSSYLIYRTAKLKNQMSKVLHNVIGFFLRRKNTETRENIEIVAQ